MTTLGTMVIHYMKNNTMVPYLVFTYDREIMLFLPFTFYPSGITLNWAD